MGAKMDSMDLEREKGITIQSGGCRRRVGAGGGAEDGAGVGGAVLAGGMTWVWLGGRWFEGCCQLVGCWWC